MKSLLLLIGIVMSLNAGAMPVLDTAIGVADRPDEQAVPRPLTARGAGGNNVPCRSWRLQGPGSWWQNQL